MKTKKVLLFIALFILIISHNVFSQQGWVWQNPKPTGEPIASVYYVNSNTIYALTSNGIFLSSADNGTSWTQKNILPPSSSEGTLYNELSVINASTVFAYSECRPDGTPFTLYRKIHKTTDGGNHWTTFNYDASSNTGTMSYFRKIKFINALTGYDFDYRKYTKSTMETTDGGISWHKLIIGSADSLGHVFFINQNTGWVAGTKGKFFKTTNGGTSWTAYPAVNNDLPFYKSYFINENTGWAYNNYFFKTTDGGASFVEVGIVHPSVESVLFIDANTGYAISPTNQVSRTTNGGANWNTLSTKMPQHFLNNSTAVTGGEYVAVSTDSGLNWNARSSSVTSQELEDIHFTDANYGWAVGINTIIKTTNGGDQWTTLPTSSIYNTAVRFINQNTGVIGTYGGIIRTTNGGASFSNVTVGSYSNYNFYRFSMPSPGTIYALSNLNLASDSTLILKSTDAGLSWSPAVTPSHTKEFHFTNDNLGFALTLNSTYKTTDGAATWTLVSNTVWNNVYFINENTGWHVNSGTLYRTSNGGADWVARYSAYNSVTYDMKFFDLYTGYRTVKEGVWGIYRIQKTTDAGETFFNMNYYSDARRLRKMGFINQNTGWIGGSGGLIIKTTTAGALSVQQISSTVPDNFSLKQNYPNPFNPSTVIRYQLTAAGFTTLKVYDLLGKEVASLVNEKQSAGSYAVDFNSAEYNLPSGIYFYTLTAGEFKETKKMVLIK